MTARRSVMRGRQAAPGPGKRPREYPSGGSRRILAQNAAQPVPEPYEQLAIELTVCPQVPVPRRPGLPPLPEHRPRTRDGRAEFDALAALCGCPHCAVWFATDRAFAAHRRNGRCLDPAEVGLHRLDRPYPCYGEETP